MINATGSTFHGFAYFQPTRSSQLLKTSDSSIVNVLGLVPLFTVGMGSSVSTTTAEVDNGQG